MDTHGVFKTITVKPGQQEMEIEPIDMPATRLALLKGQPAPELREVVAWKNRGPINGIVMYPTVAYARSFGDDDPELKRAVEEIVRLSEEKGQAQQRPEKTVNLGTLSFVLYNRDATSPDFAL